MSVHDQGGSADRDHNLSIAGERGPTTIKSVTQMAERGEPFACLTAYDFTTARWLERAGVHLLLTGDSAANVILGLDKTIDCPLGFLITISAAVKRGAPNTLLMGDMPFMSYHASPDAAIENAGRFLTEGSCDIVKLEADESFAPLVQRMTRAGIPVCAHVGTRPQTWALTSGPKAAGRTNDEADQIVADAVALERAGAVMLLIEAVPPETTRRVLDATSLPLIGIGAGTECHGQILVVHDLVGLGDRAPRFAEPVADLGPKLRDAASEWVKRVAAREIGGQQYRMRTEG
ncbi:MAG: 3-methyl-2-oxobutanoate hydroxymethyltransferase [Planctomycetota bacterium]